MTIDPNMIRMLQELSDAPGASGFEDEVVAVARQYAAPIGELKEDFLRNLYIYRKENTGTRPVLMIDAHSDEVGLIVHSIKPNGCLRFLPLGSWNKNALVSSKVLIRTADGDYIPGIIAAKPVHFMTAAEKALANGMDISDMVIDIGAVSYEDAVDNFHIRIGEPIVPATKFHSALRQGLRLPHRLRRHAGSPAAAGGKRPSLRCHCRAVHPGRAGSPEQQSHGPPHSARYRHCHGGLPR